MIQEGEAGGAHGDILGRRNAIMNHAHTIDGGTGKTLECTECAAALEIKEGHRTAICPYCRCPSVVERPAAPDRPNPTFVLPFTITPERARECVTLWTKRARFFHRGLSKTTIQEIQ